MMRVMPTNEPANPSPQFVDVFEMRFIGAALRRHGWVVLLAGVLGVLIGLGLSVMSPPVYRAEAVLLVNIQSLKIGADGVPMDVEVVLPARRLVGTVCESDEAMSLLAVVLSGELKLEAGADLSEQTAWLREHLYYDQRGLEMAALRAVAADPEQAAELANKWAEVSRSQLSAAYGTTANDVLTVETLADEAEQDVIQATQALAGLPADATEADRIVRADTLDKAQRLLSGLNERWAQLQVRLTDSEQIARIVSPASPPAASINPSPRLVMGLFGFAGLLVGLATALLRGPAPGSPGSLGPRIVAD